MYPCIYVCMCVCVFSMECTESEKAAATKRDVVKAKVDEINEKLSQLNDNKKEKLKDVKKTRKYASDLNTVDVVVSDMSVVIIHCQ